MHNINPAVPEDNLNQYSTDIIPDIDDIIPLYEASGYFAIMDKTDNDGKPRLIQESIREKLGRDVW